MRKAVAALFLSLALSGSCFAQGAFTNTDGIWQNIYWPYEYYSIHTSGDTIVVIDMFRVESTGSTLRSAFAGKLPNDLLTTMTLTQQAPDHPDTGTNNGGRVQIGLRFRSTTEADVLSLCNSCSSRIILLHKRF